MANLKDVAREANVSTATVSYVLNNAPESISPETRETVLKAAEKLDYYPDYAAKALRTRKTKNIGLILAGSNENEDYNYFMDPMMTLVIGGAGEEIKKNNYSLLLAHLNKKKDSITGFIKQKGIDGIIIMSDIKEEEIENSILEEIPVVLFQEREIDSKNVCNVSCKNKKAFIKAIDYLSRLGHKNIGYVSGALQLYSDKQRLAGFKEGLKNNGLEFKKQNLYVGDFKEKSGHKAARMFTDLPEMPTAVCCANDRMAIGLIGEFKKLGFDIPEDVSVIGYDDIQISKYFNPPLTTIKVPYYEMSSKAVELIIDRINENNNFDNCIEFEPELSIRDSCRNIN